MCYSIVATGFLHCVMIPALIRPASCSERYTMAEDLSHIIHDPPQATHTPPTAEPAGVDLRPAAPVAPGLVGDLRLAGRGNGPVRAAGIHQLQQTAGNRAAARIVQRRAAGPAAAPPADLAGQIQSRAGGGDPLPGTVQRQLESHLESDLSNVRVHTDSGADQMAQAVDAVAFTSGSDIFFRQGTYDPGTPSGLHLLAHETTHTVQQAAGPVAGTPAEGGVAISDPSDSFEQAAEATAARVAQGAPGAAAGGGLSSSASSVQREAVDDEDLAAQAMRPATYAAVQRQAPDDEDLAAQAMRPATYAAVQRQAADDEDLAAQAMRPATYAAVQREGADDEDLAAQPMRPATYAAVQRQAPDDEDLAAQAMRPATYAAVQRQALPAALRQPSGG